jgi:hypothetical protein
MAEFDPKVLERLQEQLAEGDKRIADLEAKSAGLEELVAAQAGTTGQTGLRMRKTFEPKFRTVRLRKFPKGGGDEDYVVGWTNKGAYEEVDRSGVRPEIINYIDVIFLSEKQAHDADPKKALKAEKVKLLDLMNKGRQVHCKIVNKKEEKKFAPTGEIIKVSTFDPDHGLIETGEEIDGFVTFSDIEFEIEIPGHGTVWIDQLYCNN